MFRFLTKSKELFSKFVWTVEFNRECVYFVRSSYKYHTLTPSLHIKANGVHTHINEVHNRQNNSFEQYSSQRAESRPNNKKRDQHLSSFHTIIPKIGKLLHSLSLSLSFYASLSFSIWNFIFCMHSHQDYV